MYVIIIHMYKQNKQTKFPSLFCILVQNNINMPLISETSSLKKRADMYQGM